MEKVCNGIYDCKDGDDEQFCFTIKCPDVNSCVCQNNSLKLACTNSIDFSMKFLQILNSLQLKNISKIIKNEKIFTIKQLRITLTETKFIKEILNMTENLVYLNLSENFIKEFQHFYIKNLNLIQNLDLSKNLLKFLNKTTFLNMKFLLSLNLYGNHLQKIYSFTFFHLLKLEELNISNNSKIIYLQKKSFFNLYQLKSFHFQSKVDENVDKFHFKYLTSLKQGYFETNEICCFFRKFKYNLNCSFQNERIKICYEIFLTNSDIISLTFFFYFYFYLFYCGNFFFLKIKKKS